jgi:hypothetical protein
MIDNFLQLSVQASQSSWYIWLLAAIISAIVYFIEPVYNVVVKEEVKTQKNRMPYCRSVKVTAVDPPKKETTGKNSSQKQKITVKYDDPLLTEIVTFEDSTRSGYDVNDSFMFNVKNKNKFGCSIRSEDKIIYDDEGKDFEFVASDAKDKAPFTVYYDKHGRAIQKNTEQDNPALPWFITFTVLLVISAIFIALSKFKVIRSA